MKMASQMVAALSSGLISISSDSLCQQGPLSIQGDAAAAAMDDPTSMLLFGAGLFIVGSVIRAKFKRPKGLNQLKKSAAH